MGNTATNPFERFYRHVDEGMTSPAHMDTPCHEWTGTIGTGGYGQFSLDGATTRAHRFALFGVQARNVSPKIFVCHKCDNPRCVNPEHLYAGSRCDNEQDKVARGRHPEHKKTHCPQGHEYSQENTRVTGNRRYCRACARSIAARTRRLRKINKGFQYHGND